MANESRRSSRAPEIDGTSAPSTTTRPLPVAAEPEASDKETVARRSAIPVLCPSTPMTPADEVLFLHVDAVHGEDPARTSSTRFGPRVGSPRDSTARGGAAPVLGVLGTFSASTAHAAHEVTFPTRPYFRDAARRPSTPEDPRVEPVRRRRRFLESPRTPQVAGGLSFLDTSSPAQNTTAAAHMLGSQRDAHGGAADPNRCRRGFVADSPPTRRVAGAELSFPGGPSFRDASTPARRSTTTAAYTLGSQRDAQSGTEPNRRRRRRRGFVDESPPTPHVAGAELCVGRPETDSREIADPSSRGVPASWVVWTAGLEGGISARDTRALELLAGQLRRELGSSAAAVGLWRFSFEYDHAIPSSWRLLVRRDEHVVASWRVSLDSLDNSGVRSDAGAPAALHYAGVAIPAPATTALAGAHGQGASASPAGRRRRSRWDVPGRTCQRCRLAAVAWFQPCCDRLLCESCVRRSAAARCSCQQDLMRRPVPFQSPYEPQPPRSLVLLRYPLWHMFHVADRGDLVAVAYYNAEEAFYGQADAVNFRVHIFYMEGEVWTRLAEVRFAFPSPDLELRLFVRVFDAQDAAAHP